MISTTSLSGGDFQVYLKKQKKPARAARAAGRGGSSEPVNGDGSAREDGGAGGAAADCPRSCPNGRNGHIHVVCI